MTESLASAWAPLVSDGAPFAPPAAFASVSVSGPDAGSPVWWANRLYKKLSARQPIIRRFDDYYIGDHPLPWLPAQARQEFRRILRMTRSNYMGLVVDAQVERMIVEGFRVGDGTEADKRLWRIWQANNLDSEIDQGFLEATKSGQAYLLVGPNPDDTSTPLMSVEHPSQAIVEHAPGNRRRRAAALKVWLDDWTGDTRGELQIGADVYSISAKITPGGTPRWQFLGSPWRNPAGEVSMVELPNNPRLLIGGVSELADVTDSQDRCNKTIADRLITQDFGAFPQKWASGYPEKDADGNEVEPIDIGRDRLVTSDVVETKFGQWDAAELDPYSAAKREDVKDIASRTRTPAQYLLGEMSNVNGATLKAAESGLISKVRQRMRAHEDAIEDAMRIACKIAGLPVDVQMETLWRSPEYRTEGELVDGLQKMATLNVPDVALWEKWGTTPQERERWLELNAKAAARGVKAIRDAGTLSDD